MPEIEVQLEYLQKLPLYEVEKPYYCLLEPHEGFDPDAQRLDNLEYETHDGIKVTDMRHIKPTLDKFGFQYLMHHSHELALDTREAVEKYRLETEGLLKKELGAVYVKTFEVRKRENVPIVRSEIDYNDPLMVEGPAKGVHNDVTFSSGPVITDRYMSEEDKFEYLKPGNRLRIINTWRTLNLELEDRPLALCDSRSVAPDDLVAADRILPDRIGEVYYLTYNPNHRWYWLEKQTPEEPFVFVMYDTKAGGDHARFCPHVSFNNARKPSDANPRRSVETRSVVITRDS